MSVTPEGTEGAVEDQEPIFGLATDCETLYANRINTLNDNDEPDGAKLLSELHQRFAAWASFLGVFAESNVCLDRRLRNHIDIQDNVLGLLDIMHTNLTCLFEREISPVHMDVDSSHRFYISLSALDAISGAVDRLNQLALIIRRSSITSETVKARKFAEKFDLASFEALADGSLRGLYPDASEGLREQLAQSMTETYALYLRRKARQQHLQAPRLGRQAFYLSPIREEIAGTEAGGLMELDSQLPQPRGEMTPGPLRLPTSLPLPQGPLTEPSSIDSHEFRVKMRKLFNPSRRSGTKSILVHQADYPLPAEGNTTCPWCFGPLPSGSITKSQWREHVNQDHLPYVCISQACSESLPRFAGSAEWFQHMLSNHGANWHQQVHAPWSWTCPLCATGEATFTQSSKLTAHFDDIHRGVLTESQARAIVGQSQFQFPRPRHICPLCCFSVADDQGRPLQTHSNGKMPPYSENQRGTESHEQSGVHIRPLSNKPANADAIATHVAAHLQFIMLLTLRLISIDDMVGTSDDDQSSSPSTDDPSSNLDPESRDRDLELESRSDNSPSTPEVSIRDFELQSANNVQGSEDIDWDYILGNRALDQPPNEDAVMDVDVSDAPSLGPSIYSERGPKLEMNKANKIDMNSVHSFLSVLGSKRGLPAEQDVRNLCTEAREIFLNQPMLLEPEAPINVVGDIHGQYVDLLRSFQLGGHPPQAKYIFLGNYIGYGMDSIKVICHVLAYKILYADEILLLRGNHETAHMSRTCGLYDECKTHYNTDIWETFVDLFNCMPVAAIIDEKIFCVHGGLSPQLDSMDQIRRIKRPTDIPDTGLLRDLLWSNPDPDIIGWTEQTYDYHGTQVSFAFGPDVVTQFLSKHDMDLIARGHELVEDGYGFFAKRRLVTIFSASKLNDNMAAMMCCEEDLLCRFQILSRTDGETPGDAEAQDLSAHSPTAGAIAPSEQLQHDREMAEDSGHAYPGQSSQLSPALTTKTFNIDLNPQTQPQPSKRPRTRDRFRKLFGRK